MSKSKGNTIDPLDLIDGIDVRRAAREVDAGPDAARTTRRRSRSYVKRAFPEGHPGLRRRRAALHLRLARELLAHAQLRPRPLRGLPQLLQQALERDALRADEHRGQGLRRRRVAAGGALHLGQVDRQHAAAHRGAKSKRASPSIASTTSPARSTASSGTSTATGTWRSPRSSSRRATRRSSAARAARWSACWRPRCASRTRSSRSSPRSSGRTSRRSPARRARPSCSRPTRNRQPEKIDEAAEKEIAVARKFVTRGRNLRSETKLPPKDDVVVLHVDRATRADHMASRLVTLVRVFGTRRIVNDLPASDSPVAIAGTTFALMPHIEVDASRRAESA